MRLATRPALVATPNPISGGHQARRTMGEQRKTGPRGWGDDTELRGGRVGRSVGSAVATRALIQLAPDSWQRRRRRRGQVRRGASPGDDETGATASREQGVDGVLKPGAVLARAEPERCDAMGPEVLAYRRRRISPAGNAARS